jgi:penicillin-binding protein 1A
MSKFKKLITIGIAGTLLFIVAVSLFIVYVTSTLPKLVTVKDYEPLVVSEVFDRNNQKIGEFFRERRTVVPFEKIPTQLVHAYISAEDSTFFEHGGINFLAIGRAFFANLKAGKTVQGGSTITQQTAKTILLSSEKTYIRKVKDILLAYKMEENLSKQDILYLYLNQIYLGQGAYGVAEAAKVYFRKDLSQLTIGEMAMLAGLPQAPSRYSPVYQPNRAKERQIYVLNRMAHEGYITKDEAKKIIEEPVTVYIRINYTEDAPYFLETVRQHLVKTLGEDQVLNKGLKIHTSLDIDLQKKAQAEVQNGLRVLDKRQGYRGATKNLTDTKDIADFLLKSRNELIDQKYQKRIIFKDGTTDAPGALSFEKKPNQKNIPEYIALNQIVEGIVIKVDDVLGLVQVRFAESKGIIDLGTMLWARKPNPEENYVAADIKIPSEALKVGDIVKVKVVGENFSSSRLNEELGKKKKAQAKNYKAPEDLPDFKQFARLELEQEPLVEGSLISFDLTSKHVLALVGGYDFQKSEYNRALQAARQSGSSFKPIVYAAALDHGFAPNSVLMDAPVVYEEAVAGPEGSEGQQSNMDDVKRWKPGNYDSKFGGDILLRTALIKSKNIPTIKILEKVGVNTAATYARRLGIFSPLNMDLSLGLGSSGITLYEMTKAFSTFGLQGQRMRPIFILKVDSQNGQTLLENVTMDARFENELKQIDDNFETDRLAALPILKGNDEAAKKKILPLFFDDPEQLLSPQTAYLMNTLLTAVVAEPGGTGGAARSLGKVVAGKTGTTNGYYDAWFIGYSPQISTGVWVGFDNEKTLGKGETGGRTALPIWINYMQAALKDLPSKPFDVPPGIVFASIDSETGKLASSASGTVVRQAFLEGTEPSAQSKDGTPNPVNQDDKTDFIKEDLNE